MWYGHSFWFFAKMLPWSLNFCTFLMLIACNLHLRLFLLLMTILSVLAVDGQSIFLLSSTTLCLCRWFCSSISKLAINYSECAPVKMQKRPQITSGHICQHQLHLGFPQLTAERLGMSRSGQDPALCKIPHNNKSNGKTSNQ